MPAPALVSIIMPTHNGSALIDGALTSVFTQSHGHFEMIIVDDGSTDGVGKRIAAWHDDRIRYIKHPQKKGQTAALNHGLSLARGAYIARIDDDDRWVNQDKLARQLALMASNPRLALCGTEYVSVATANRELYRIAYPTTDATLRRYLLQRNPFIHSSVLIRKSALDDVGNYNHNLHYAQDYELWLRLGAKYELANLPGATVVQHINPAGLTSQKNFAQLLEFLGTARKFRGTFPGFYANFPLYGRELLINLLPKATFYQASALKRRALS